MKPHGGVFKCPWMLAGIVVLLIAGHGLLYRALSTMTLSAVVMSGVIILIAIKSLGLLGLWYARFRRRSRP